MPLTAPTTKRTIIAIPHFQKVERTQSSLHNRSTEQSSHDRESDIVEISPEARAKAVQKNGYQKETSDKTPNREADTSSNNLKFSEEEQKEVAELKKTDREVKNHESAHKAAAGGLARGGVSFKYVTGPDGKRYAVEGHVDIDTNPVPNNPKSTIRKAQTIRSAALAPSKPSAQDRSVAAQAVKMEREARRELREQGNEESGDINQEGTQKSATDVNVLTQSKLQTFQNSSYITSNVLDVRV